MATGSFGISPSDLAFLGRLTVVSTHQRFSTFGLFAIAIKLEPESPCPVILRRARAARSAGHAIFRARARPLPPGSGSQSSACRGAPRAGYAPARPRYGPKPRNHPAHEQVGFRFGVGPEQVMGHFVINHLYPHPFGIVDAAALPIFGMYQMDTAIVVSLAGRLAPIEIFKPGDTRPPHIVEPAKTRDGPIEHRLAMGVKEVGQFAIDHAAMCDRGQNHSHEVPPARRLEVVDHTKRRLRQSN